MTNVNVTGNQTSDAGGVFLRFADGLFTGSTFSNNMAVSTSGGITYEGPAATYTCGLVNSTVSGNRASALGGGMRI